MPAAKVSPSIPSTTVLNRQSIKSCDNLRSVKPSLSSTESNDSSDNFGSDLIDSDNSVITSCNTVANDMKLTPYQRVIRSLQTDERWQREIMLGRRVGFYRFRGEIGTGNFSQVKVAVHCLTREKVAVKILDKSKLDSKTRMMLLREISSMESLNHPNIISIFEVIETLSQIHIVMEFAPNGELFQFITREGRVEERDAKVLFAQIVSAIDHMHRHNIIHRDIKAENIFFADHNTIKIGDFGFSTHIERQDQLLSTFCGSPPYAAPELFSDESYCGRYVDYWALGVLLYFMVTSLMPFKAQTISSLKKLILEGIYDIPDHLSAHCVYVIKGLLQVDFHKRWDLNGLKTSEWLSGQTFPECLPKYSLQVFHTLTEEQNNNNYHSSEERQAYKQLLDLGISDAMINDNIDKGSKSTVNGSFAIIMNRIIKSNLKKSEMNEKKSENQIQNDHNFKCDNSCEIKRTKSSKSLTKSLKSLKNTFIDKTFQLNSVNNQKVSAKAVRKERKLKRSKTCCLL